MKIKNKLCRPTVISIETMIEQKTEKGCTENKTLYWLVNVKYSYGRGLVFRANSPLQLWANLMTEVYL